MKISELSDLDLSRLIAEEMEPFANLPSVTSYLFGPPIYSFPVIPPTYWRDDFDSKSWQPRNFITDPAMTMMLLEKLLELNPQLLLDARQTRIEEQICIFEHLHLFLNGLILGRAIAEAYALAHGLGEK